LKVKPFSLRNDAAAQRRTAPRPDARRRALAQFRGWDWGPAEKARQTNWKRPGEIMPRVLAGLRMECRQAESEILKVWNHQLDPNIVAHAQPTGIRDGTLFVTVDNSVWMHEIVRYRRLEILERLRNSFGSNLIVRISFRIG
jgi:hypothetical protein